MSSARSGSGAETFLKAGVLVGPLFVGLSLVLAFASPAFDLTKHEVSLLLVGNLGWLQTINFIANGLLGVLCAVGLRRALKPGRASLWGPITLGAYGVLLILAGFFHPDPQLGFPSGAPAGIPTSPTSHDNLLGVAIAISFWVSAVAVRTLLDSRAVSAQVTGLVRGI